MTQVTGTQIIVAFLYLTYLYSHIGIIHICVYVYYSRRQNNNYYDLHMIFGVSDVLFKKKSLWWFIKAYAYHVI
jgi:hypothetical protein